MKERKEIKLNKPKNNNKKKKIKKKKMKRNMYIITVKLLGLLPMNIDVACQKIACLHNFVYYIPLYYCCSLVLVFVCLPLGKRLLLRNEEEEEEKKIKQDNIIISMYFRILQIAKIISCNRPINVCMYIVVVVVAVFIPS